MTTYATVLFLFVLPSDIAPPDESIPLKILMLAIIGTFLFPAVFIFMLVKSGRISNLKMDNPNERNWPLLLTTVIYGSCYYALHTTAVPAFIQIFMLGATCSMAVTLFINLQWKISLHTTGIGGFCGAFTSLMLLGESVNITILALAFVAAGLVGTARLYLQSHNEAQVGFGFLLGFLVESGLVYFLGK